MTANYRKLGVIKADKVPDWRRIQPKWDELVEDVLALEPGDALVVEFDTIEDAHRARNAVRVRANEAIRKEVERKRQEGESGNGQIVEHLIRTRVVPTDAGKFEVSLIRSYPLGEQEE